MADETIDNTKDSSEHWLSGLIPKKIANTPIGRFTTNAIDNSAIGAKAGLAKRYVNTTFSPAKEPGGNFINDIATELWKQAKTEFNKADSFAKGAQHSNTLGEWAGNVSQGLGHLGGAALPGIGPAAAAAGEQIGKGDIAGGLGSAAGMLSSVFLGGKLGSKAGEAALDDDVPSLQEDGEISLPKPAGGGPITTGIDKGVKWLEDKMLDRDLKKNPYKGPTPTKEPGIQPLDTTDQLEQLHSLKDPRSLETDIHGVPKDPFMQVHELEKMHDSEYFDPRVLDGQEIPWSDHLPEDEETPKLDPYKEEEDEDEEEK